MSGQRSVTRKSAIRHVLIRGRVQGVGYRAWTELAARERGLGGWVRNRRDGAVEALLTGETAAVEAMLVACRAGPPAAQVDHIEELAAEPGLLDLCRPNERFTVLPTV
jgi:acylphosphatase